jgi:pimeloyl-ACP methyl ester carboxylesterase
MLRASPAWEGMVALAPQSVREWAELARARLTVDRYAGIPVPTLLLTGSESRDHPSFAIADLERALPDTRTEILEGQAYIAHRTAPALLARAVTRFLPGSDR